MLQFHCYSCESSVGAAVASVLVALGSKLFAFVLPRKSTAAGSFEYDGQTDVVFVPLRRATRLGDSYTYYRR